MIARSSDGGGNRTAAALLLPFHLVSNGGSDSNASSAGVQPGSGCVTSRASTPLLARSDDVGASAPRGPGDVALLAAFALLNAPFLLKGLYGGSKRAKRALLDRLGLPERALPHTGGWKADVGLLAFLADHIAREKPSTVVEFGTGASTLIIAKALEKAGVRNATFISFEQHRDFCQRTDRWLEEFGARCDIRHAPLKTAPEPWPGLWYDHGPLPEQIDLLVVDGPQWTIHPFTRGAAETLFGKLRIGGTMILDDAARPGERIVARRWRRLWPQFDFTLHHFGSKGTLVGRRLR